MGPSEAGVHTAVQQGNHGNGSYVIEVCLCVCVQSEKYGLSFVKLHSTPVPATDAPAPTSPK